MISVIIPLYNKEKSIGRTIQSVLNQSIADFELIIVDDGSTDCSADIVKSFSDERIKLVSQSNSGVSVARNRGIHEAKGEYVAFLDADDEWDESFLDEINNLIETYDEAVIYGTNYVLKDYHGNRHNTILKGIKFTGEWGLIDNYFEIAAISSPPICSICVAIRKRDLKEIGGFPSGIVSGEDLLTWARLIIKGKLAYSKRPLSIYNLGEGYEYTNPPARRQDKGDPVGKELKKLLNEHPHTPGLRKYISHWHKMRASVAIRFGERLETIQESFTALKYNPLNYKVISFIVLACMPVFLRKRIIAMKKH